MEVSKKKTALVLFLLLIFFSWTVVDAKEVKTGRVAAMSGLKLRLGPGTNYGANVVITYNSRVTILGEKASESGCSGNWYYVTDSGYYGYVCSQYIADDWYVPREQLRALPAVVSQVSDHDSERPLCGCSSR